VSVEEVLCDVKIGAPQLSDMDRIIVLYTATYLIRIPSVSIYIYPWVWINLWIMLRDACLTINSRPTLKSTLKSTPTSTLKSIQSSTPTGTYLAVTYAKILLYKPTHRLGSKNVLCSVFIAFLSDFS